MLRKLSLGLLLALVLAAGGCSMCASPYDYCGPTHNGCGPCCGPEMRQGSVLSGAMVEGEVVESTYDGAVSYEASNAPLRPIPAAH